MDTVVAGRVSFASNPDAAIPVIRAKEIDLIHKSTSSYISLYSKWSNKSHQKIFVSVSEKCAGNFEKMLSEMRKVAEEKVKTVV